MKYIQYFVFDKSGNDILEASAIPVEDSQITEAVNLMVKNFKTNGLFKDTQLFLSCGNEILFSSTAQQCEKGE